MKVLLTGGTGFVGRCVLDRLHAAGHSTCLLVRNPQTTRVRELANRFTARLVGGDLSDFDSLGPAFSGADAVIHLVGIISELGRNTFDSAHRVATENVVRAAGLNGIRRYVHMSALGTRPNAVSRYHQTKWAAEEAVRQSAPAWTIFRPSLIYGAEDQFMNLIVRLSRWSPILPIMGRGQALLQPVSVDAVAAAFVGALTEPRAISQTYDLCGPDRLRFVEVIDQLLDVLGRRRLRLRVPLGVARMQAAALEFLFPRLLRRASPLNRDQLVMLEEDNVGDPGRANALFGLPVESFREGVRRCLLGGDSV